MDHILHDETITIAQGKRALSGITNITMTTDTTMEHEKAMKSNTITMDGPTTALLLHIKRQEMKRIRPVVGVRMTMVHSRTAIHEATIPTKTVTATVNGEMMMQKFTRKAKTTTVHLRNEGQETSQAPTVTGDKMTMKNGVTPGDMKKNTMAVAAQPGAKVTM